MRRRSRGEMSKMSRMGVGITAKSNLAGNPTLYVEYHQCDQCGAEFRLYFKTAKDLGEALVEIAKKMGFNGKEDLCYSCMSKVPADQMILTL